jgi:hypothetical protein
MFYDGSLQEGISTAVGQQKLVFCFVTSKSAWKLRMEMHIDFDKDDNDESKTWEDEFLKDPSVSLHATREQLIADSFCS